MSGVKVVCAQRLVGYLTEGKTYTAYPCDQYPDHYEVTDDSGASSKWFKTRFSPVAEDSANPKDALGMKKVNAFLVPPALDFHAARAFEDGAAKYGPYNWREKKVKASVYIAAAKRHLSSWQDGEAVSKDAGVHHLGHVAACIAILLDAEATGNLIDDRPKPGAYADLVEQFKKQS